MGRKKIILFPLIALFFSLSAQAQTEKYAMGYIVNGKDTIFVDELPAARCHPRSYMSKQEWVKYYKRVHNFSKAYPYALFISQTVRETDSIFIARGYTEKQKEQYLNCMKNELVDNFDPILRQLTLSQGLMMIRLIDRETGRTPYSLIHDYLGVMNAGFWQGVAKVFKGDLKRRYDQFGEDKDLEDLVYQWNRGEFDELYSFIFGKPKPEIYIPPKFRQPYYESLTVNARGKIKQRKLTKEEKALYDKEKKENAQKVKDLKKAAAEQKKAAKKNAKKR